MTTDELIARAKASLEGVTLGPWFAEMDDETVVDNDGDPLVLAEAAQEGDLFFIAASRQLVPDLIGALTAAEARAEQAGATVAGIYEDLARVCSEDPNLSVRICCNGQDCGCRGATAGDYVAYRLREMASTDAQAALDHEPEPRRTHMKIIAHSSHPGLPDRITIEHNGKVLTAECRAVPPGTSERITIVWGDEMFIFDSTPSPVPVGGWHAPYADEHRNTIEAPMISAARIWRQRNLTCDASDLQLAEMLEREDDMSTFHHPATPRNGVWISLATLIETGSSVA